MSITAAAWSRSRVPDGLVQGDAVDSAIDVTATTFIPLAAASIAISTGTADRPEELNTIIKSAYPNS